MSERLELARSFGKALHAANDPVRDEPLPGSLVVLLGKLTETERWRAHLALAEQHVDSAGARIKSSKI